MSQLIAAAIGAAGALGGVVVAGVFTLVQTGRNSADRQLDRLEQRRNSTREARREVYAQMVSSLRRASAAHEAVWRSSPATLRQQTNDAFVHSRSVLDELEHSVSLVKLAGPPELGDHADDLYYHFEDLIRTGEGIVSNSPDATEPVMDLATQRDDQIDVAFSESRLDFISTAREILGDHQ
ncbi:hypothetical protein [Streptomyces sp. NPDC059209]|uniref:hypothetical protein n=1 Tax=Streptomyces sp. NPDC059209 TaxID=3346769 RepID=UPI00367E690B